MRTLISLAGLFAACGGSTEVTTETPEPTTEAPAPAPVAAAPAGAATCDSFADHMLASMEKQAEAAGDNEFMTADQAKEFATAMVTGIRTGCKSNDRLGEFPEVVGCYMEAEEEAQYEACKSKDKSAEFDEYIKGLLSASIQLDAHE